SVRRAQGMDREATCSRNVHRGQVGVRQKKRRTWRESWTRRPDTGRSPSVLRVRLWTCLESSPQPGQGIWTVVRRTTRVRHSSPRIICTSSRSGTGGSNAAKLIPISSGKRERLPFVPLERYLTRESVNSPFPRENPDERKQYSLHHAPDA